MSEPIFLTARTPEDIRADQKKYLEKEGPDRLMRIIFHLDQEQLAAVPPSLALEAGLAIEQAVDALRGQPMSAFTEQMAHAAAVEFAPGESMTALALREVLRKADSVPGPLGLLCGLQVLHTAIDFGDESSSWPIALWYAEALASNEVFASPVRRHRMIANAPIILPDLASFREPATFLRELSEALRQSSAGTADLPADIIGFREVRCAGRWEHLEKLAALARFLSTEDLLMREFNATVALLSQLMRDPAHAPRMGQASILLEFLLKNPAMNPAA